MNTSALIIEHVISGIQASVWLLLIYMNCVGFCPVDLTFFQKNEVTIGIIYLAMVYPLGVLIDNMADYLLSTRSDKIKEAILGDIKMGSILEKLSSSSVEYFSYLRMRIRICRVTLANSCLITVFGLLFVILHQNHHIHFWQILLSGIIFGSILGFVSFWNWKNINKKYFSKGREKAIDLGYNVPKAISKSEG